MTFILQLFLAHIIGDFFLQGNRWIISKETHKWRSPYLYIHVLVHFVLILVITWDINNWKIAIVISLLHLLIDGIKLQFQQLQRQRLWFFADQLAHVAVLLAIGCFHEKIIWQPVVSINTETLIKAIAVLFVLKPASLITKTTISRWTPANNSSHSITLASLKDAGEWIGYLERLMILIFILLNKWEAIGFLLAAKSVFRFGDLKEPRETKLTEYVVIGTFLSFFIAIITGLIALYLINLCR